MGSGETALEWAIFPRAYQCLCRSLTGQLPPAAVGPHHLKALAVEVVRPASRDVEGDPSAPARGGGIPRRQGPELEIGAPRPKRLVQGPFRGRLQEELGNVAGALEGEPGRPTVGGEALPATTVAVDDRCLQRLERPRW